MKHPLFQKFGTLATALCCIALVLGLSSTTPVMAAAPEAGTSIGNQASATYTDASGTVHNVTSNAVYTIVQQVASLTLTSDNVKYATPSGLVSFPHTLTNTGNGSDTFDLSILQSSGDSFDMTGVLIYPDANGDGIADPGAAAITNTGAVLPGGNFKFVIVGTIPNVISGSAVLTVTATSQYDNTKTATNNDSVTVTNNAVVVINKAIDIYHGYTGTSPVTFTFTYTNPGNQDATNFTLTDVIPAGMTYIPGSAKWSGAAVTDASGGDPAGIDYSYTAATRTVLAKITTMAKTTSGSISFQVSIDSNAMSGDIYNTATFEYNDGTGAIIAGSTNTTDFFVDPTVAVAITGQTIPSASQGATVTFTNVVTNNGNSIDTFDMTLSNSLFPIGSTIVLYRSDGVTPLLDTNGNSTPDTGPLDPGATYNVVVKVKLPADAWGNKGYAVNKTATSSVDNTKFATTTDIVNVITRSTVDLTNNRSIANGATAADGLGTGPEGSPVTIKSVPPAYHVDMDLYVNNTSSVSDSYVIQASTDPTFATIVLPAGWTILNENDTETIISETGMVAPGGSVHIHSDIYSPSGTPAGTYHIYYRVMSPTTGAFDIKHDAVTIDMVRSISIVPNNSGQVFPGGSVVYTHTVTNNGNVAEGDGLASLIALTTANTQSGFSSAIYWDKNNNGVLDSGDAIVNSLDSLVGGLNGASTGAGLEPGESATLFVKVYAPAGASAGIVDVCTLTAMTSQGTYSTAAPAPAIVKDTSAVIAGDVRVVKEQALDADGNGTPDSAYQQTNITTGAVPGSCVRYRITVTNTGTTTNSNIVISDSTPAYTTYHAGDGTVSATGVGAITLNGGSTFTAITVPSAGSVGTISATISSLAPGQTAVIYFEVKINQ